ncbi:MAG: oxidoreductase [Chitinivibrionales bacterium]|nr:oxidoreductase [Chitinivibrionales bacterium]
MVLKAITRYQVKIQSIRHLSDTAYVIRTERKGFEFKAGQFVNVSLEDDDTTREYSIYSPEDVDCLEFLIKEIPNGFISRRLKLAQEGSLLTIDGPYDEEFTIQEHEIENNEYVLIATGTGIAPFHSFALTHPKLNYRLLHGIRAPSETYDKGDYKEGCYVSCVSQEDDGDFRGRVTHYLKEHPLKGSEIVYICGNGNMIFEVSDSLIEQGFCEDRVRTEIFF